MKKILFFVLMILAVTLSACTNENKNYKIVGHSDKYMGDSYDSLRMDDYESYVKFTSDKDDNRIKAFEDLYIYDEAFFEENTLLYIAYKRHDSGFDVKLNSVNFIDDELVFNFSYKGPDFLSVIMMEMYLIEIKKSYLEDYPIRLLVIKNHSEFDRSVVITDEIIPKIQSK